MDDPWANAWSEPTRHVIEPPKASSAPSEPYTRTDDTASPSWTTVAGDQWTDPPGAPASLWAQSPSPYDSVPAGNVSLPDTYERPRSFSPDPVELTPPSPILHPPLAIDPAPLTPPITDQLSVPIPQSPTSKSLSSIPGSPDAFGTFESGFDSPNDPWTPSRSKNALESDSSAWGAAWGPPDSGQDAPEQHEPVDEWEAAKLQKEKQDRQVPPQLLASIIHQFEELSSDLWPNPDPLQSEKNIPDEQDFRVDRRDGLEGVEGLATIVNRIVPQDLTLPPNVQFAKTFTSKHMADALRLTRHVPLARVSPMAQYMASKGSTAWEASVKSRPEVVQDDFLPPGWRVVQKDGHERTPENDNKKRPSGGRLLSFFGRRAATPLTDGIAARTEPPVRTVTASSPPADVIPRSSDHTKSVSTVLPNLPTGTSSIASSSPTITPTPAAPSPTAVATPTSTITPPKTDVFREPTPPPSAVSRFLNRFSRPKPATGPSPRNSLALSSNDLEFLSDLVPGAKGDVHNSLQLDALSSMIESSPLPTKLPPPLAPPPGPSVQPTRTSSNTDGNPSAPKRPTDGFNSLFNSRGSVTNHTVPPPAPVSVLPLPVPTLGSSSPPSGPSAGPLSWNPNITSGTHFASSSHTGTTLVDMSQSSPFDFPPPSSSRTNTPAPPPKRAITAVMSTSTSPPPVPKSNSPFNLPPPPSSRTQTLIDPPSTTARSHAIVNSNPPPIPTTAQLQEISAQGVFDNDDEFSDFHSSTVALPPAASLYDSSFSSSTSSNNALFSNSPSTTVSNPSNSFDDFDDFVSTPIRTPSPPRPPAKATPIVPKPLLPSVRAPSPRLADSQPQLMSKRKMSRAANHSRTISLVETAAAHPGRWPAPPSPLPEVLPPPGAPASDPFELEFFGRDGHSSTMQAQQTKAYADLSTSTSSPAALASSRGSSAMPFNFPPPLNGRPPPSSPPLQPLPPSTLYKPPASSPALTNTPPSTLPKSGGLSAQDLSFFEGL